MNIDLIDLSSPIAMRKRIRSCTKHPISDFVTYEHLSHSIEALVTNLSSVEIPKNVQDEQRSLEWKNRRDANSRKKNGTWVVV